MFGVLKSPIVRYLVVSIAVFAWAYTKGRSDCAVRQANKRAEAAEEWASGVASDLEAAYKRGAEAARMSQENADKVEEISREAEKEQNSGDECVSADTVERLRQLQ